MNFALKKTFDRDGQNFDPLAGVRIALSLRVKPTLPAAFPTPVCTHHHSLSSNQSSHAAAHLPRRLTTTMPLLRPGLEVRMLSRILGHRYPKGGVEGCSTSVPSSDNRF